jgi:DNA-binding HxlR family transcriptional regulator
MRYEYNANLAKRPGHEVLATLSDSRVTPVISALADDPPQHGELTRITAGASQKTLTQTLRKLKPDGGYVPFGEQHSEAIRCNAS